MLASSAFLSFNAIYFSSDNQIKHSAILKPLFHMQPKLTNLNKKVVLVK